MVATNKDIEAFICILMDDIRKSAADGTEYTLYLSKENVSQLAAVWADVKWVEIY